MEKHLRDVKLVHFVCWRMPSVLSLERSVSIRVNFSSFMTRLWGEWSGLWIRHLKNGVNFDGYLHMWIARSWQIRGSPWVDGPSLHALLLLLSTLSVAEQTEIAQNPAWIELSDHFLLIECHRVGGTLSSFWDDLGSNFCWWNLTLFAYFSSSFSGLILYLKKCCRVRLCSTTLKRRLSMGWDRAELPSSVRGCHRFITPCQVKMDLLEIQKSRL